MVCNKCSKLSSGTKLATPGVKKKSDMYYGSPASSSTGEKKSATLGQTGVSKSKLLSKSAKNPYAQYSRYVHELRNSSLLILEIHELTFHLVHAKSARLRCLKGTSTAIR